MNFYYILLDVQELQFGGDFLLILLYILVLSLLELEYKSLLQAASGTN